MVTFLTSSLQHMGFKEHMRPIPSVVGMGDATPFLWTAGLSSKDGDEKTQETLLKRQHVAFTAESKSSILDSSFVQLLVFSYGLHFPRCISPISIPIRPLTKLQQ